MVVVLVVVVVVLFVLVVLVVPVVVGNLFTCLCIYLSPSSMGVLWQ